ncbi:MAG: hypothetical protein HY822_13950 [Acidobacteria bacterium]|nr:hypothetical protein [Acidobacteriota bacterium]
MKMFCAACGSPVQTGGKFCGVCGQPLPEAPAAPPPSPPAPLPCQPPPPYQPPPYQAVPPPNYYAPPQAAPAYGAPAGGGLPASPQPWDFQVTVAGYGENLARSLGMAKPGAPMGLLEMMLRGAFLDGRVYRQAALDEGGNGAAILALALPFILSAVGSTLLGSLFSFGVLGRYMLVMMTITAVVGILATVVALVVMSALSQAIVGWKLGFGQIFRALAYAQSPGVLGIIPVLGALLGLWRIPTSLVAIREISAADGGKSAILLIVGGVASVVAGLALSPLLLAGFAFLR